MALFKKIWRSYSNKSKIETYLNDPRVPQCQCLGVNKIIDLRSWIKPPILTNAVKDHFAIAADVQHIEAEYLKAEKKRMIPYVICMPELQYEKVREHYKFITHGTIFLEIIVNEKLKGAGTGGSDCALFIPRLEEDIRLRDYPEISNVILLYDI